MFCQKCGKSLAEGEVCDCSTQNSAVQNDAAQPEHSVSQTSQESALPQGKELADSAKNAANAVKNNPYVAEVLKASANALKNPVKQTVDFARRKDILWMILAVVEGLLYAISTAIFSRRLCYALVSSISGSVKYSDMADTFDEVGLTIAKQIGIGLLSFLITALIAVVLMMITVSLCKRKTTFSQCGNMLAAAFLPAGILMAAAIVASYIFAPLVFILFAVGYIGFIVLGYLGIQKLDKFETSPFWPYTIFAFLITLAGIIVSAKLSYSLFEEIIDELMGSLSSLRYFF